MSKGLRSMKRNSKKCWILKTTSGGLLKNDHWEQFNAENVVAVGWGNLRINPIEFASKDEYRVALERKYSGDNTHAANTIYDFSNIPTDDVIIIARGYKPSQEKPVHIYGIAQAGIFIFDIKSNWWIFKRKTQIYPWPFGISQSVMANIFGIDSCLRTLHGPFSFSIFNRFCKVINFHYGFSDEVLICDHSNEPVIIPHSKRSFCLDELDSAPFSEGSRKKTFIDAYERNPKARKACIEYYGFHCQVCGMLFSDIYGKAGKEVIQVHHLKPIYKSKRERIINPINDLIPVCANCHVIIHTRKPPYSIREIKGFVKNE
ncbi:MAG TPA: hypothetical protein DCO75_10525 [Fibrobacteres bacterium]|jgi:hypothetical protein|nr:hypothetical protein [Fibrobacterota bacterium]